MTHLHPAPSDVSPSYWKCFLAALQFLTRVPVSCGTGDATGDRFGAALSHGVVFFPLVGGMIGIYTSMTVISLSQGLSPLLCALIAIGLEALLTGAFHEDAFADTCDGLGGGWTRDRVLEIMEDSRLGTYGTLALGIGVGLRVAAMAALLTSGWLWASASIVAASALGRLAIVGMMVSTSPIPDRSSQANELSASQTCRTFWLAAASTLAISAPWVWLSPGLAIGTITAAVLVLAWFRRKILLRVGGTTGDLLGCSAYLCQLVVLIGSAWIRQDA